jgi:hypothetical protein
MLLAFSLTGCGYSNLFAFVLQARGRDSVVVTATGYGLDGAGIESQRGGAARLFAPAQTGPGAHPAFFIMGNGSLSRK